LDILALMPGFGNLALTVLAFVLALSIIVAVHEYGHYIVGRWSGIHAEVFSLGFGPVLLSRVDRHGTRWQLAALPFGGYVKFLGDADAASGKDDEAIGRLSPAERRHTMHGAPLWARAATVAAGPVFNFIFSALVFAGFFWVSGIATDEPLVGKTKAFPYDGQPLLPGDRILALEGTPVTTLEELMARGNALPPAPNADYRVLRDGAEQEIIGPHPYPALVDSVQPKSAADESGILPGDLVRAIDGTAVQSFGQMREIVGASEGRTMVLTVQRGSELLDLSLTPRRVDLPLREGGFETRWLIGLTGGLAFGPELRTPGVAEGLGLGVQQVGLVARTSLSGLWHMITGAISSCNLQGPLGIAEATGTAASQGIDSFIWLVALLSAAVGLMNLLPVPVLDGGHLVFYAWEAVMRRPPSDAMLQRLMSLGLIVVLATMAFGLTNDLFCR